MTAFSTLPLPEAQHLLEEKILEFITSNSIPTVDRSASVMLISPARQSSSVSFTDSPTVREEETLSPTILSGENVISLPTPFLTGPLLVPETHATTNPETLPSLLTLIKQVLAKINTLADIEICAPLINALGNLKEYLVNASNGMVIENPSFHLFHDSKTLLGYLLAYLAGESKDIPNLKIYLEAFIYVEQMRSLSDEPMREGPDVSLEIFKELFPNLSISITGPTSFKTTRLKLIFDLIFNGLSNAAKYGIPPEGKTKIEVLITIDPEAQTLSIHNSGNTLFDDTLAAMNASFSQEPTDLDDLPDGPVDETADGLNDSVESVVSLASTEDSSGKGMRAFRIRGGNFYMQASTTSGYAACLVIHVPDLTLPSAPVSTPTASVFATSHSTSTVANTTDQLVAFIVDDESTNRRIFERNIKRSYPTAKIVTADSFEELAEDPAFQSYLKNPESQQALFIIDQNIGSSTGTKQGNMFVNNLPFNNNIFVIYVTEDFSQLVTYEAEKKVMTEEDRTQHDHCRAVEKSNLPGTLKTIKTETHWGKSTLSLSKAPSKTDELRGLVSTTPIATQTTSEDPRRLTTGGATGTSSDFV